MQDSDREGRHYYLWEHTFMQVLKGFDVLACNDPAYNIGTKRGKSLPPIHTAVSTQACQM